MITNEKFIRASEASAFLGIDTKTLMRWVKAHNVKHILMPAEPGRKRATFLVWKPALDEFLEKFTVKPEQPAAKPEPKKPGAPVRFKINGR